MKPNVLVIEHIDAYNTVFHLPFSLLDNDPLGGTCASDTMADIGTVLAVTEGLDLVHTHPVGEYALHVSVAKAAGKPEKVLGFVLAVVIGCLDITSVDELRVKYPASTPRRFERQLGRIVRQLAKDEWKDDSREQVRAGKAQVKALDNMVEQASSSHFKVGRQIEDLDEAWPERERELTNAKRALKRAHAANYDADRIIDCAARVTIAQEAMAEADTKQAEASAWLVSVSQEIAELVDLYRQAERELDELKARKCPKFFVGIKSRGDMVTLSVSR